MEKIPKGVEYIRDKVTLRYPRMDDVEALAHQANDKIIHEYLDTPFPYTVEHAVNYIKISQEKWVAGSTYNFVVETEDKFSGMISLMDIDEKNLRAEVGYWLSREFRGKGNMTVAVKAVVDIGFQELGLERIWARTDHDNPKSTTVLERAGFIREGRLREHAIRGGKRKDEIYFGLIPGDLKAKDSV